MRRKRKQTASSPPGPAGHAAAGDALASLSTATSTSTSTSTAGVAPCTALHHDIANRAELHANAQHVWSMIQAARPKNTQMAYTPKQKEFQVGVRGARVPYGIHHTYSN
jgi:regulation of enolase protein 1 (concanavalin A-like superfamily)